MSLTKKVTRTRKVTRTKKVTDPTIGTPPDDPDPVGFGKVLAEFFARLEDAYRVRLRVSLGRDLLVRFPLAARRRMLDAPTVRGGPVSFYAEITMHPPDASGSRHADGKLMTPAAELAEPEPDQQPDDDPEDPTVFIDLFGKPISKSAYEKGLRKSLGRKRRRYAWRCKPTVGVRRAEWSTTLFRSVAELDWEAWTKPRESRAGEHARTGASSF
jgi:hypothetical protein